MVAVRVRVKVRVSVFGGGCRLGGFSGGIFGNQRGRTDKCNGTKKTPVSH